MTSELDLPSPVLTGVAWDFQRSRYRDVASFARAVERFHTEAHGAPPAWRPEAVVLPAPAIRVRLGSHGQVQTLRSPGPEGFTGAGLLFALHDAMRAALEGRPDHYLHGLWLVTAARPLQPALYEIRTAYWLGTEAERPKEALPREIMRDVLWSFVDPRVKDRAVFAERVRQHEVDIRAEGDHRWDPDALVLPAPVIWVGYMHWLGGQQVDRVIVLRSAGPGGFTAADLLHQIHQDAAPRLARQDHHFFEGLTIAHVQPETMPPGYFMLLGS
jgi:hypothetical protein